MDFKKIRSDFPIFSKIEKMGRKFVYLDSAATTHKPQQVIDSIVDFYTLYNSNVHRGLYDSGEQATALYEGSREKVAKFINAKASSEIIFTSGTTESINFVAQTWAASNLKPGDEILLTQAEHHANLLPWQRVAKQTGAVLKFIPIFCHPELDSGSIQINSPEHLVTSRTKLVAVTYISNVLGDIWATGQLESLITAAKKQGAKILIDAAQAVAHRKVDVQTLNVDFMAFSGHKMFAPTGIGVLYIKSDLHDQIESYKVGGGMVNSVSFQNASWAKSPHKFEAGTPAIAQAIGLGVAIDYISQNLNFEQIAKHEVVLHKQLLAEILKIKKIKIAGNISATEPHGSMLCFAVEGVHAHDIAGYVGGKGISVRAGHHCAQPLVKSLGFESLVRVSFGVYNTEQDVDAFVTELKEALKFFGV
ncbi:MAG: SufS family cysteine desulfurase [bacterium]